MFLFQKQKGSLLVGAIMLIVVVGLVAATVVRLAVVESTTTTDQLDSAKAFYIAQAGLERAAYYVLYHGTACSNITGDLNLTNISFGEGAFTVTGTSYNPTPTTLNTDMTDVTSVIPVVDLSGYASLGRVQIGSEYIDYYGTSSNSATCNGSPPCLINAVRGQSESTPEAHSAGNSVIQNMCMLDAEGAVPDLVSPYAKREVSEGVILGTGKGWIVGNVDSSGETILNWSGTTWMRYGPYASIPNITLRDIALTSGAEAWAVGDKKDGYPVIIYWDGATWLRAVNSYSPPNPEVSVSVPNKNLDAVICPSDNCCLAVGDSSALLIWNGSIWDNAAQSGVPDENFNDIACVSDNDCWAVGNKSGDLPVIIHWDGSQWTPSATGTTLPKDLLGVDCTSSNNCWAVGRTGTLTHWDGSTWSNVSPPAEIGTLDVNSISCVDANDCWAVADQGALGPLFVHWNGSVWSTTAGVNVENSALTAVSCSAADDCWAVGKNQSIVVWNGTQWTGITPAASVPNVHMRGIVFEGGVQPEVKFWREVYN